MAKLVLSMFTSLDGYIEGPGGQFLPPAWSDDLATHWSGHNLEHARHLVYGRTNFVFNRDFWTAEADPDDPDDQVSIINRLPKTVVSSTLTGDPGWNAELISSDLEATIGRLKTTVQGDIYCFGGAGMANSLMALDLVDEYRLMVTPVIFGDGKRLFDPGLPRQALKLIESRPLDTGAVILHYVRDRAA